MKRHQILHFDDINASHAATGFSGRTDVADFHIFRLEDTYPSTRQAMPPYTLRFYCVMLLENSTDASFELNSNQQSAPDDTISFQAPGHIAAWVRGAAQRGFIIYFQPEFLSQHPTPLIEEFPFFRPTEVNVLPLTLSDKTALHDHLVRLEQTFTSTHPYRVPMLQALLTAFLFDCKGLYENYRQQQASAATKSSLAASFQQLVEQHYLTRQSVQGYAELLNITPNYLSQEVSKLLGYNAHDIIADRLLVEAKKLLNYTDLTMAEVADYLGFSEPAHFTRFFKRKQGLTPLEYRRSVQNKIA